MIILFTVGLLLAYAGGLYVIWNVLDVGQTFKLLITIVICIPMITFVRNFLMRVAASAAHKKAEADNAAKEAAEHQAEEIEKADAPAEAADNTEEEA